MARRVALLSLFFVSTACVVAQTTEFLPVQNTRGLAETYLRPLPLIGILGPGENQTAWSLTVANEFRTQFATLEDGETWRLRYMYRRGTSLGEWLVSVPFINRSGGIFDPFISFWHNSVINFDVPDREAAPFGGTFVRLHDGTKVDPGTGLGDITVGYGFRAPGTPRVFVKIPTGNPSLFLGSGGFDAGISAGESWRIAPRLDFASRFSLTYQSPSTLWSDTRPWIPAATLALVYTPRDNHTFHVQWTSEEAPVRHGDPELDRTHRVISFGYTQVTKAGSWTYWITEDGDFPWLVFNGGATIGADLTFGVRFTVKK